MEEKERNMQVKTRKVRQAATTKGEKSHASHDHGKG